MAPTTQSANSKFDHQMKQKRICEREKQLREAVSHRVQTKSGKQGKSGKMNPFLQKSGKIRKNQGKSGENRKTSGKLRELLCWLLIPNLSPSIGNNLG